jgi:hypothetical protein
VWHIGANVVRVWDEQQCVQTTLPDGRTVVAAPQRTAEYLETAIVHGYGWHHDPAWAMAREHDAVHLLLSHAMDLPTSRTLSDVADGIALEHVGSHAVPEYQWLEESRVMDLARYLNTGDDATSLHGGAIFELSWQIDLPAFRADALRMLRLPSQSSCIEVSTTVHRDAPA